MSSSDLKPTKPVIPKIPVLKTPPVLAAKPIGVTTRPTAIPQTIKPPGQLPTSPRTPLKQPKFNTHIQQHQIGGAKAPTLPPPLGPVRQHQTAPPRQTPHPEHIPHPPPALIPERQRPPHEFERRFPVCTFQRFPERFRDFDRRFDDDRRRHNCLDFREEFDDDDQRRFRPFIRRWSSGLNIGLVEHILGLSFNPIFALQGQDVPRGSGIWVLGVDGLWYRVNQQEANLIQQIESQRGIDNHMPVLL